MACSDADREAQRDLAGYPNSEGKMACSIVDSKSLRDLASNPTSEGILRRLSLIAAAKSVEPWSEKHAQALDEALCGLSSFRRGDFVVPKNATIPKTDAQYCEFAQECIYMVGNSLGIQPRRTREMVNEELDAWATLGVNGHWAGQRPWMPIDELVIDGMSAVVGAKPKEVAVMNSLTVNLHLLMVSFYAPKGNRKKIMYESDAFGSDYFAFKSQADLHELNPDDVLVPIKPRQGETTLRTEDIVKAIEEAGDSLAVLVFGTVQYYTGQFFDVQAITAAAQRVGAAALWDCAHAAGNINLKLHDWGVDGACWCSYKYLNSGPGGIAGLFVHEKHHGKKLPILSGWWGQQKSTRFNMKHEHLPEQGASAWRLSNPPVLQTVSLLASLEIFGKTSMDELRGRSMLLTGYLEKLLHDGPMRDFPDAVSQLTPSSPKDRGCQLSLKFSSDAVCSGVFQYFEQHGVVADERKPNVIRLAPAPLYSNFTDVFKLVQLLSAALRELVA